MVEKGKRPLDRYSTIIALADALRIPHSELAPVPFRPLASRVASSGAAVHAEQRPSASAAVDELCAMLTNYGSGLSSPGSAQPREIPSMDGVERQVKVTFDVYQQGRFTTAAKMAAALLADAELAAREYGNAGQLEASKLLALSYQAVASVLTKVGQPDLALIAAERGLNAAESSGLASVRASLVRCTAFTLHSIGRFESAMRLVDAGADYVKSKIRGDDAVLISVCGTLLLVGSMAAARSGDGTRSARYLEQASGAARRLGGDANHLWTAFGPTNVAIHRVNTAVELGDARTAIRSGLGARTTAVPPERRVRYLLDVARAHGMAGDQSDALGTLLAAEKIAPDQVRQHYVSRKVVMTLTRNAIGKPPAELAELARRMKISELD
jgi:hypothetical protein